MKHLFIALALIAALFVPSPTLAQGIPTPMLCSNVGGPFIGNYNICYIDPQGRLHVTVDPANGFQYVAITASGNTIIKASKGTFFEIINLSTSAQSNTCTWYDNPATNAGQVLYAENSIGPSQIILTNSIYGLPTLNGLTVNCTGVQTVGLLVVFQ